MFFWFTCNPYYDPSPPSLEEVANTITLFNQLLNYLKGFNPRLAHSMITYELIFNDTPEGLLLVISNQTGLLNCSSLLHRVRQIKFFRWRINVNLYSLLKCSTSTFMITKKIIFLLWGAMLLHNKFWQVQYSTSCGELSLVGIFACSLNWPDLWIPGFVVEGGNILSN